MTAPDLYTDDEARTLKPKRGWTQFKWTDTADRALTAAYVKGTPIAEIPALIGCSRLGQITNRAVKLKLRHRTLNRTLEERFWDYVSPEPNSGCWLWTGSADEKGYGQFRVARGGPGSLRYASHVSMEIAGKPLPPGLFGCHTCDNPPCVNPDHLFPGTQLDNVHDCMAKGRKTAPPICKKGSRPLKIVCINGHLIADGFYIRPDGTRACRLCRVEFKARKRAAFRSQGLTSRGTPRMCADV